MTNLLAIRLNNPSRAFIGKAAGQLEDDSITNVYLIAGAYQLSAPGLKAVDVTQISMCPIS